MASGPHAFSNKAQSYAKGRPTYPEEAIDLLIERLHLNSQMTVADIGAGTGLLTRSLATRFKRVVAVEPNDEMRVMIAETAINGTGENTNLATESVDAVFVAQAFHWFEPQATRSEFSRILSGPKPVALIWNDRQTPKGSGAERLDEILRRLKGDLTHPLEADEGVIADFFQQASCNRAEFDNPVSLTQDELKATVLSRSYSPQEDDSRYPMIIAELEALFKAYASQGVFTLPYRTSVYWGWL